MPEIHPFNPSVPFDCYDPTLCGEPRGAICNTFTDNGAYYCTRAEGHAGPHVAHTGRTVCQQRTPGSTTRQPIVWLETVGDVLCVPDPSIPAPVPIERTIDERLPSASSDWLGGHVISYRRLRAFPSEVRTVLCSECHSWRLWYRRRIGLGHPLPHPIIASVRGQCGQCERETVFRDTGDLIGLFADGQFTDADIRSALDAIATMPHATIEEETPTEPEPEDVPLPRPTPTTPARRGLSSLTFGVEIECLIPGPAFTEAGWSVGGAHSGRSCGPAWRGWTVQSDGSLRYDYPMVGAEIVSPVLKGQTGLASVIAMVDHLKTMGARVNQSCGFHVHVGWSGDAAALRRLICFVSHHEPALFAVTGTHDREQNQYCASIKTSHRTLATIRTIGELSRAHMSRYHVLNLTNLLANETGDSSSKRTVEFRVFAGTLNTVKIAAYVQLCLGMVQRALDSRQAMPWDATLTPVQARKAARTPGLVAMARLLSHLNWYRDSEKTAPIGVFDRDTTPSLMAILRKMARKYDGLSVSDTTEIAAS